MGGAVSSGRDNNELIDNLMGGNYIRTRPVERVFRSLDRADYMTPESRDQAYKDLAWRNGPLHMSAPCIYSEVLEGLELRPGLSFLNIGCGTGYFSTLVGLIIGPSGINHGVEVNPFVLEYSLKKLGQFIENSPTLDEFEFCEPKFYGGNGLSITPMTTPYDRLYCGAGCPEQYQNYFKQLIKVGGVLVMPLNDNLVQIKRTAVDTWTSRSLLNVSFATLRVPNNDEPKESAKPVSLDEQCPARLQVLARAVVRRCMRAALLARHPHLREPPPRRPQPANSCPRRICIPIEDDSDVEGLNALHDLDHVNGANEMNALLSLVLSMGQNRVAGALRFDSLDSPSDSEEDDDDNDGAGGTALRAHPARGAARARRARHPHGARRRLRQPRRQRHGAPARARAQHEAHAPPPRPPHLRVPGRPPQPAALRHIDGHGRSLRRGRSLGRVRRLRRARSLRHARSLRRLYEDGRQHAVQPPQSAGRSGDIPGQGGPGHVARHGVGRRHGVHQGGVVQRGGERGDVEEGPQAQEAGQRHRRGHHHVQQRVARQVRVRARVRNHDAQRTRGRTRSHRRSFVREALPEAYGAPARGLDIGRLGQLDVVGGVPAQQAAPTGHPGGAPAQQAARRRGRGVAPAQQAARRRGRGGAPAQQAARRRARGAAAPQGGRRRAPGAPVHTHEARRQGATATVRAEEIRQPRPLLRVLSRRRRSAAHARMGRFMSSPDTCVREQRIAQLHSKATKFTFL